MRLQDLLNKFSNNGFLLTVDGLCIEMSFSDYADMKKLDYWQYYKNRRVEHMTILTVNGIPELRVFLKR